VLLFLCVFISSTISAAPLQVGDSSPVIELKDQFDKAMLINEQTKMILFAAEKSTSEQVTKALEMLPPTSLADKGAVYMADISGMPGFITKMVAIPRMQKLAYSVTLIRNSKESEFLPKKAGAVTLIQLEAGRVKGITYLSGEAEIAQALK
jgi:hypothetical protein